MFVSVSQYLQQLHVIINHENFPLKHVVFASITLKKKSNLPLIMLYLISYVGIHY